MYLIKTLGHLQKVPSFKNVFFCSVSRHRRHVTQPEETWHMNPAMSGASLKYRHTQAGTDLQGDHFNFIIYFLVDSRAQWKYIKANNTNVLHRNPEVSFLSELIQTAAYKDSDRKLIKDSSKTKLHVENNKSTVVLDNQTNKRPSIQVNEDQHTPFINKDQDDEPKTNNPSQVSTKDSHDGQRIRLKR